MCQGPQVPHEGSIFTKNGGDLENKGTGALLLVEPDGGSLPDALFSARVVVCDEGSSPDALFSARVVVCVDPTVSSICHTRRPRSSL